MSRPVKVIGAADPMEARLMRDGSVLYGAKVSATVPAGAGPECVALTPRGIASANES